MEAGCVGGKRRKWEEISADLDFCAEVAEFLRGGRGGRGRVAD